MPFGHGNAAEANVIFALPDSPNEKETASVLNKAKVLLAKYDLDKSMS